MGNWASSGMIERFVDTSGWAELADRTLLFHAAAVAGFEDVWNQGRSVDYHELGPDRADGPLDQPTAHAQRAANPVHRRPASGSLRRGYVYRFHVGDRSLDSLANAPRQGVEPG